MCLVCRCILKEVCQLNGACARRNGGKPSSRERAAAGGPAGRVHGPIFKTLIYYHNLFHERYLVTEFNTPAPT